MLAVAVAPQPLFIAKRKFVFEEKPSKPFRLSFAARLKGWAGENVFEKVDGFWVDILTLVAVALGQVFGFKRGL